ncbi:hypothetical protein ACFQGA_18710 [Marinobacter koreensis]|uniref:hypothetical protein n=1 Tax=Marinobacter koreensis TaxID=335974 RepID=UPI00200502F3|nr:hypothetical protein [Marinobacter koreensis]MCK7548983.1 hypothetical protein [Marinobacter koreensis]
MEINDYWNDRGAPERIEQISAETGAGQMEQPGEDEIRNSLLKPVEWEHPFSGQDGSSTTLTANVKCTARKYAKFLP